LFAENGDHLFVSNEGVVSNSHGDVLSANVDLEEPYQGESNEPLVIFSKDYLREHPMTDFLIFGHRHIELDLMLSRNARLFVLGEWIRKSTYVVWDGETMYMDNYSMP
jgi:UDP-2,3-diacylglucosamine hydrolase